MNANGAQHSGSPGCLPAGACWCAWCGSLPLPVAMWSVPHFTRLRVLLNRLCRAIGWPAQCYLFSFLLISANPDRGWRKARFSTGGCGGVSPWLPVSVRNRSQLGVVGALPPLGVPCSLLGLVR